MNAQTTTRLNEAISEIDTLVPDTKSGLPEPLFYLASRLTPMVNVDLVIQDDDGRTLLTWRHDRFYGPGWHIPGGIVRFKEELSHRIHEVARLELNAQVAHEATPSAIFEIMNPNRDIRGHFISLVFKCRLLSPVDPSTAARNLQEALPNQWIWADRMPPNMIVQQRKFAPFFRATGG